MQIIKVLNTYEYSSSDNRQFRYWSPTQQFASGDQLARYLQVGWGIAQVVEIETLWFGEARHVSVYRLRLFRNGAEVLMRVLGNPFIRSLVRDPDLELKLVPYERNRDIRFKVIGK